MSRKIYLLYNEDGDYVQFAFASEALALEFCPDGHVQECELFDSAPPEWTYWTRGAAVYPDGVVEDWTEEHVGHGEVTIPPVDDHLNQLDEPWNGHTASHCGEHVCIHGTDREGVEVAFQAAVARAVARQDGECKPQFWKHRVGVDGKTVYETGFLKPPRAAKMKQSGEQ